MDFLDAAPARQALSRLPALVWAAAWRAQGLHLVLFVALPLALFWLHQLWDVALMPMPLMGFGEHDDRSPLLPPHLQQPGCWLALAPCGWAEQDLPGLPVRAVPDAPTEPFLPLPTAVTGRHLWFALWLVWFGRWLWQQRAARKDERR